MTDLNKNGIPDEYEGRDRRLNIDIKSFIAGAVFALFLGGGTLTIAATAFPESSTVKGVAKAFAGGVCDPLRESLALCEIRLICYETAAAVMEIDDSKCQGIGND